MEIGLSEMIKFCARKLIKRTHFMSPLKMINLLQDIIPNFSPKNLGLEPLRPVIFMINRRHLKPAGERRGESPATFSKKEGEALHDHNF